MCPLTNPSIGNIFSYGTCVISKAIIPLIFGLAIALFVWGVVKFFIINVDEEAKRSQGKQFMIWGIIALVAISSVWGLVRIFGKTFGLNTQFLPGVRPRGSGVGNSNEDFIPEPSAGSGSSFPQFGNECKINNECNEMDGEFCSGGYCVHPL